MARNTTSPTRALEPAPPTATSADPADAVTGGATAPDEESGFGHGVDGLTPRSDVPSGGSQAPAQPPAGGGATAPADTPAAGPTAAASAAETAGSFK